VGFFDTPMRARNNKLIGLVGTAILVIVLGAVVLLPKVSFVSGNKHYSALFTQAAGIGSGDDVRVAGIPVGTVTSVKLDLTGSPGSPNRQAVVKVGFTVPKSTHLGADTGASIEVATLLGTKYVELTPAGAGALSTSVSIPTRLTQVPFDLSNVTNGLHSTVAGLDIGTIQKALQTVSSTFSGTPDATREALKGLAGISKVITSRQSEFTELLTSSQQVTATLAAQRGSLDSLFSDADQVLQTIRERRTIIHELLIEAAQLGQQLTRLVNHNAATLGPLLDRLHVVTTILRNDDHTLAHAVDLLAPASRGLANATGDGPYIDVNLPYLLLPDNVLCAFAIATDCK
jgi:phospholipid/cholesterol/gamma-HCH transport system substrate-binding protein